jgi:hypothetical protein
VAAQDALRKRIPIVAAGLLKVSSIAEPIDPHADVSFLGGVSGGGAPPLDGHVAERVAELAGVYSGVVRLDALTNEQIEGLWDATAWALEYRIARGRQGIVPMLERALDVFSALRTPESHAHARRELRRLAKRLSKAHADRIARTLDAVRSPMASLLPDGLPAVPATIFDQLIAKVVDHNTATFDDLLAEAGRKLGLRRLQEEGPALYLRTLRPGPEGDLIASTVLRLLSGRYDTIDASEYRLQIVEFIDGHYAQRLRAVYQPPRKRTAYEVLSALAPVAVGIERNAQELVAAMRNLDNIEALRQELMKLVGGGPGQVILGPFLLTEVLRTELSATFDAALALRDADNRDAVNTAYRRVRALVEDVARSLEAQPTEYGSTIILGAAKTVQEACKRRSQLKGPPARLVFQASERPLPLREPTVSCFATITVTNEGEAAAADVELSFTAPGATVTVVTEAPNRIGRMEPQSREDVSVSLVVVEPCDAMVLSVSANWTNLDHTIGHAEADLPLRAQAAQVDWERFEPEKLFAPYPVERPENLVGRERQLATLRNHFASQPLANLYVTGQRRVGKTSLVRVLVAQLKDVPNLVVASVEMGEVRSDAAATIGALGRKLAERTLKQLGLADALPLPRFGDSLAPLAEVLEQLLELDDSLSFLFVIDEFDQLPHETYRRDGPGDALFLPMRSLAQKPEVGWLLVGGETMPFIRDEQAAKLNTFRELSVDYLPLIGAGDGRGFGELVRGPLPDGFSVDDSAVRAIHHQSAGNPHFAKAICAEVFARAEARRDAVVRPPEIEEAVDSAAHEGSLELFVHFWEDGIFGAEEERRRRELSRREYLTACAKTLRSTSELPQDRVQQIAVERGLETANVESLRAEFVSRGILRERDAQHLDVHVPFFQRWLETEGIYKLPPKGIAERFGQQIAATDESYRISDDEIKRLARRWKEFKFRGESVTRDAIESWLQQFELPLHRRLAFRLLERLRLVSDAEVYHGFQQLQRLVARDSRIQLKPGQKALTHMFVSALGGPGSSGEAFVYTYRQANNVSRSNIVPASRLKERLASRDGVKTVVLVDDFIGSGGTAMKSIAAVADQVRDLPKRASLSWYLFAVTGLPEGVDAVASSDAALQLGLRVELAHPLSEASLPFSSGSSVFTEREDREQARRCVVEYGERIGAKWPLGFGGDAALVVFPDNCPNNAPAILWSDAGGWGPLFARTGG